MAMSTLRGAAVLAAALLALPSAQAAVLSKIDAVPSGWSLVEKQTNGVVAASSDSTDSTASASSASDVHVFSIALSLQNIDNLEQHLLSLSTPGHASYGNFLDIDEVAATYAPSTAATEAVTSWLKSSGVVKDYQVSGHFIDFATDIAGANKLFNASYNYYAHESDATTTKLRTLSYAVPDEVAEHIALVDPGNYFGKVKANAPVATRHAPKPKSLARGSKTVRSAEGEPYPCDLVLSPTCLKEIYNIGNYTPDADSGSFIGFGSFLNQSALYADLALYEETFDIPAQNFTVELFEGGVNHQDINYAHIGEADLDVQNIIGIAHPLPVIEYITGGLPPFVPNLIIPAAVNNSNEPYLPYYRNLLAKPNRDLPQVISNSYGDEENSVPYNYAVYTCNLIGLAGLRGITIIESSGDSGVGGSCLANDFKTPEFSPIFPATCPYLTSVGGTVGIPEIAWTGSSGGFSRYFKRPAYQSAAIQRYVSSHVDRDTYEYYKQYTNWQGRGFPDVAGYSLDPSYYVFYNGDWDVSGGTSAAAPVWAGIIGLLNDARFRRGKSSLGWLNPLIYAYGPQVLTDITGGNSTGCTGAVTGGGVIPYAYWNATTGWDPATGFGTPNFEKMLKLAERI